MLYTHTYLQPPTIPNPLPCSFFFNYTKLRH